MKRRWLLLVLPLTLAVESSWAAQAKPNKAQIQHQVQDIAKARERLNAQKKELDAAKAKFRQEQADLAKMREKAAALRKKIEDEHNSKPELASARRELDENRSKYEGLSKPLLAQVHESSTYKAALINVESVRKRFAGSAGETPEVRDRLGKEFLEAQAAPKKLETAAIEADPKAKAAKEALTYAEGKMRKLIEARDAAIAKDPRIAPIIADCKKAEAELAQAENKLSREAKDVAEAERKLNAEEREKRELEKKAHQPQHKPQNKKRR
jgi:Skp family chaperone for outer membrane proteins